MKNLLLLIFVLIIVNSGCINSKPSLKAQLVQMCLDDIYKSKGFEDLKKPPLILIKNQYSRDLANLHFGENKVILKDVSIAEQEAVLSSLADKNRSFFRIGNYKINADKSEIGIYFPLLRLDINLSKVNDNWIIKNTILTTGDNILLPPVSPDL